MQEVNWEVRQMPAAEIANTRRRSNRMYSLRNKMATLKYGEYIVIPESVFDHGALRQAVHRVTKELGRGRYRCLKDSASGELRVLFLGE